MEVSLPYFRFFPKDFMGDCIVQVMNTEEVGAYVLLLCCAWQQEPAGSLPNDDNTLSRMARLDQSRWLECKKNVLAAFSMGADGRHHQKRMQTEHAWSMRAREYRSEGGKKGMKARWGERNGERKGKKRAADNSVITAGNNTVITVPDNSVITRASGSGSSLLPKVVKGEQPEQKAPREGKVRERDHLFDSVAEVAGADPKVNGAQIAKVCKQLRAAEPPYTPEEVRALPEVLKREMPYLQGSPTVGTVEKYIGKVRATPSEAPKPKRRETAMEILERIQREKLQ
jgi:uncharacterized protein YdaU (DUF1376 family)